MKKSRQKNEVRTAISNICPFCGDRGDYHKKDTLMTQEGIIKIRICLACNKKYQRLSENLA